jgi:hypothetical protein
MSAWFLAFADEILQDTSVSSRLTARNPGTERLDSEMLFGDGCE